MKRTIIISILFISVNCFAQITLDFQSNNGNIYPIKLNNSTTKYLDDSMCDSLNEFVLYNNDGSYYKTIFMPTKPSQNAHVSNLFYVTTSLFDNDSSNIEYLVYT
jgi:hypothetical protein